MDTLNYTTESRKQKHLNYEERMTIQIRLKDRYSPYKIAKELRRCQNTILNEIRRGTVSQIKQGKKVMLYQADTGNTNYCEHRKNCGRKYRRLLCDDFLQHVCVQMKEKEWSVDACVGDAVTNNRFSPSEMVCTKTIYNYIDLNLLSIRNADLPFKLRIKTKTHRICINKKKLGRSIEERPEDIQTRSEFGHWEIDTVIGQKSGGDNVLLTIAERQTRDFIIRKIASKTAEAVMKELDNIRNELGNQFSQVFKTITGDNGSEFADLYKLEQESATKVYFTHPYSSFEKGTNERHNGLIRRFIPKGKAISGYSLDEIAMIEEWCNSLPRKILGYRSPEELFDEQMDIIFAA